MKTSSAHRTVQKAAIEAERNGHDKERTMKYFHGFLSVCGCSSCCHCSGQNTAAGLILDVPHVGVEYAVQISRREPDSLHEMINLLVLEPQGHLLVRDPLAPVALARREPSPLGTGDGALLGGHAYHVQAGIAFTSGEQNDPIY